MKKIKTIAFLSLLIFFIMILCSCRCVPHNHKWHITSVSYDVQYANGQTIRTSISDYAHDGQPNGVHDGRTHIEFCEDGRVSFKPLDSEELQGTYTYMHNGLKDTSFCVEFENGEKIENGYAEAYYFGRDLRFQFRGVGYTFRTSYEYTEEEYRSELDAVARYVRKCGTGYPYNDPFFATVTLDGKGGALTAESLDDPIDIYAEGFGLTAVQITAENGLIFLDEPKSGECVCVLIDHGAVVYYLDPLPEKPLPPEPEKFGLIDFKPDLAYYFEHSENTSVKMSRELSPARPGNYNVHNYLSDEVKIEEILDQLKNITLTEVQETPDLEALHYENVIILSDKAGEKGDVRITEQRGRIYIGGDFDCWFTYSDFPEFEYDGSVRSFSYLTASVEAYNEVGYMCTVDDFLHGFEFIVEPDQDHWNYGEHDIRTVICEFGELLVYDATHFWYNGQFYFVVGEKNFSEFYEY